jgi:hypothetical protein
MALFNSKFDDLVYQYQRLIAGIAHVNRGDYHAHDAKIADAGAAIIAYERENKIREAREDLAVERTIAEQVASLEKVLHRYSGLSEAEENLVSEIVAGNVHADEIESRTSRIENFDKILKVTKEGLRRLKEWSDKIAARKAKLSKTAIADALKPDPFGKDERASLEAIFESDRANRWTREQFAKITKPEPALA